LFPGISAKKKKFGRMYKKAVATREKKYPGKTIRGEMG